MAWENLVGFAQDLVRRPSLSCQEGEVAKRVEEEMRTLGYDQVTQDPYGSIIGVIEGAEAGPTLLFDAHTDTVDVTGGIPWAKDPFSGDIVGGCLQGRGSADMKGALAAMVHAAGAIDRTELKGRIVVVASTMEEVLEGAALMEVMKLFPPDFVVIGEATELNLARGGRGRAEIHLETRGIPTHSSVPHLGRNAVLDMMEIIRGVEAIELDRDPLMGPAILALTEISSVPFPSNSVIPSICRAIYDRRLLPGETKEDVLGPVTDLALAGASLSGGETGADDSVGPGALDLSATVAIGEYTAFTGNLLTQEKFFPAWIYPEDDWFVTTALDGLGKAGLNPESRAYQFCTNAAHSAGIAGVPTVGFGPAREWDAHVVDERVPLSELEGAARGYQGIIRAVLGG